jgi:hypothetical protein
MKIVPGGGVPLLGWLPRNPEDLRDDPDPVGNGRTDPASDKPLGGLWTSPLIPARPRRDVPARAATSWTLHPDRPHGADEAGLTVLEIDHDARITVISCLADLRQLPFRAGEHSGVCQREPEQAGVDWEAVAMRCDGVWLTRRGQRATHFTTPGLACWTCETVWLTRRVWTVRAAGVPIVNPRVAQEVR